MQPNSLVVVKPMGIGLGWFTFPDGERVLIEWLPVQDESTEYVIREIFDNGGDGCCTFVEGTVGFGRAGEIAINLEYVREVQPPINVQISVDNIIQEFLPCECELTIDGETRKYGLKLALPVPM